MQIEKNVESKDLNSVSGNLPSLEIRVHRLEDGHMELMKRQYALDTSLAEMRKDIQYIKSTQDDQTAGIRKVFWAIGAIFITYLGTFVLNGGLAGLQP